MFLDRLDADRLEFSVVLMAAFGAGRVDVPVFYAGIPVSAGSEDHEGRMGSNRGRMIDSPTRGRGRHVPSSSRRRAKAPQ